MVGIIRYSYIILDGCSLTILLQRRKIQFTEEQNRKVIMTELSKIEQYLQELAEQAEDPICKRLITAYKGSKPMESMETELGRILKEVVEHED